MSDDKYISFEPWWAGYSNVRMSFEMAIAISEITGRKLIVPPSIYFNGINDWKVTSSYVDIFSIWDKDVFFKTFNAVEYNNVQEYVNLNSKIGHFNGVDKIADIKLFGDQYKELHPLIPPDREHVIHCGIDDQEDYDFFAARRVGYDLTSENKFIHFPRNLFGHFYFHVYAKSSNERNYIKENILRGIQFKEDLYDIVYNTIEDIRPFNALHIRRGDFLSDRPDSEYNLSKISDFVKQNGFDENKKTYIATDEVKTEYFNDLDFKEKIFFKDLYQTSDPMTSIALDMITCTMADDFIGSRFSTFSDYINVNRIARAKKAIPLRYNNHFSIEDKYDKFPWENKEWNWHDMSSYFWTHEKDDRTIFINIASYRDTDVVRTIEDAREKSAFPNRLHFGVFVQDNKSILNRINMIPGVKSLHCDYKDAKGCGWARNKINNELYSGEDFFIQVDSHCRFRKNWDIDIIRQIEKAPENSFLTGFPPDFRFHMTYDFYIKHKKLNANTVLSFRNNNFPFLESRGIISDKQYQKTFHVSGSNCFGKGIMAEVVRYDDNENNLINPFLDQEIYSCLAFVQGYNFYVPTFANVWHNYEDNTERGKNKYRPLLHEDNNITNYIKDPLPLFKYKETKRTCSDWVKEINIEIENNKK